MGGEPATAATVGQGNVEFFLHRSVERNHKELLQGYKRLASEKKFPRGDRVKVFSKPMIRCLNVSETKESNKEATKWVLTGLQKVLPQRITFPVEKG